MFSTRQNLLASSRARLLAFAATSLILCGFGSCDSTMKELCAQRFPSFTAEFSEAVAVARAARSGRTLAAENLNPVNDWNDWSMDRLKETQRWIDLAESEGRIPALHDELMALANELVLLHGYNDHQRNERLVEALEQIQAHGDKARTIACP